MPDELQQEALRYVDYLLTCQGAGKDGRQWSRFSVKQLAAQYAESDAIYDRD